MLGISPGNSKLRVRHPHPQPQYLRQIQPRPIHVLFDQVIFSLRSVHYNRSFLNSSIRIPYPTYIYTMILRSLYLSAAALLSFALADVQVTSPAPGDSISGLTLDIEWKDSGKTPKLADLASFQIFLCAGGNSDSNFVCGTPRGEDKSRTETLTVSRFNWRRLSRLVITPMAVQSEYP